MKAFFVHNSGFDTVVIPEAMQALTVGHDARGNGELVDFLSTDPDFSNWASPGFDGLDWRDAETDEELAALFGEIVASREEDGPVEVLDADLWERRLEYWRVTFS